MFIIAFYLYDNLNNNPTTLASDVQLRTKLLRQKHNFTNLNITREPVVRMSGNFTMVFPNDCVMFLWHNYVIHVTSSGAFTISRWRSARKTFPSENISNISTKTCPMMLIFWFQTLLCLKQLHAEQSQN